MGEADRRGTPAERKKMAKRWFKQSNKKSLVSKAMRKVYGLTISLWR